jgi:hypothetical protein
MTNMESDGTVELLRMDAKGRVRVTRERREALMGEYDRSGMSARGFAEWAGIKSATFGWWLQQRRKAEEKSGKGEPASVQWVEAEVAPEREQDRGGRLRIELECGARMEVVDRAGAALAAEVLRQLGKC